MCNGPCLWQCRIPNTLKIVDQSRTFFEPSPTGQSFGSWLQKDFSCQQIRVHIPWTLRASAMEGTAGEDPGKIQGSMNRNQYPWQAPWTIQCGLLWLNKTSWWIGSECSEQWLPGDFQIFYRMDMQDQAGLYERVLIEIMHAASFCAAKVCKGEKATSKQMVERDAAGLRNDDGKRAYSYFLFTISNYPHCWFHTNDNLARVDILWLTPLVDTLTMKTYPLAQSAISLVLLSLLGCIPDSSPILETVDVSLPNTLTWLWHEMIIISGMIWSTTQDSPTPKAAPENSTGE